MRILNLTHSPFWYPQHFDYLLSQTGHTGETMFRSEGNFNGEKANRIWRENKEYFDSFDAIFVSHLATWSRVFLQNGWQKPLFVYVSFRFDHDVDDLPAYHRLLLDSVDRPNVKFMAMTAQDRLYMRSVLWDFPIEVAQPFIFRNMASKTPVQTDGKFFLIGKHNESIFAKKLDNLGIPMYHHRWETANPDWQNLRGVIHFPYVCATRSLFENLAMENVYFLPDENMLCHLVGRDGYFWDGCREPGGDFSQTEWYREENKKLFIYYSSFEELRDVMNSRDIEMTINLKKQIIRKSNLERNALAKAQWKEILQ